MTALTRLSGRRPSGRPILGDEIFLHEVNYSWLTRVCKVSGCSKDTILRKARMLADELYYENVGELKGMEI